jgi:hypothetical protein
MSKNKSARIHNRARNVLLAELELAVGKLVKANRTTCLDEVLNGVGFFSNVSSHTAEQLGTAITTLAPMCELEDLAGAVHTAVYKAALKCGQNARPALTSELALADYQACRALDRAGYEVLERFLKRVNANDDAFDVTEAPAAEVH